MVFDETKVGELRGTINAHIQQCGDFKKAMWAIFVVAVTINAAAFGYLVRIMDIIRDSQAEIKTAQVSLERADVENRNDMTARLSMIVQSNLQRESGVMDRIRGLENSLADFRKDIKEDLKRDRERR